VSASLVIQTSFLGDVVLTTPLLRRLSARGPVTVVTTVAAAALLDGHPAVHRLVPYDKRARDGGILGFVRLARALTTSEPDATAYLAQGSHRSGALARAAGYRRRVGFATSSGRAWYTDRVTTPPGMHHAERLWRLAGSDDPPPTGALRPSLSPQPDHDRAATALLEAHGLTGRSLVALAPGSIWGTKRWPHYPALAAALARAGRRVVVVGARDDAGLARAICDAVPGAIDATGQLTLLGTTALFRHCALVVSNDSLPLHLASAVDTPTVAIFGPTVPAFGFGPLATRHHVVERNDVPCRPCHRHGPATCPLGHFRCMQDLPASTVMAAVEGLLS
jgi:heptosyltransferase-2